jgi:RecA-family ATPase
MDNIVQFSHAAMPSKLVHRRLDDFRRHEFAPCEFVLDPWLPTNGLAMIAGPTGLGKTWLGLGTAFAIASGGSVLGWHAPKARKVLYVDGEMPITDMQARIKAIHAAAVRGRNGDPEAADRNLFFFCDAEQEGGIPNLATSAGRGCIERKLRETGAEVLYLDNLSCLVRDAEQSENTAESWVEVQEWLLKLRRTGYTVVLLHHTGKAITNPKTGKVSFKQRGTSKHEDVLNTSILLLPVPGAANKFKVTYPKHRGFLPPPTDMSVEIFYEGGEARLQLPQTKDAIVQLHKEHPDWTQQRIADELGNTSQPTVQRVLRSHHDEHPDCLCRQEKAA